MGLWVFGGPNVGPERPALCFVVEKATRAAVNDAQRQNVHGARDRQENGTAQPTADRRSPPDRPAHDDHRACRLRQEPSADREGKEDSGRWRKPLRPGAKDAVDNVQQEACAHIGGLADAGTGRLEMQAGKAL